MPNTNLGDATVELTEVTGDIKVSINGQLICYVSSFDVEKFINELNEVITKYRI